MMKIIYPHLETIDPILTAIKGREEFGNYRRGNDKDGHWNVIDYNVNFYDTFPNIVDGMSIDEYRRAMLRRECRGIVFDSKTGRILRRPFHKYFNVNERPETQQNLVSVLYSSINVKMDGSMIAPFLTPNGTLLFATRMGVSDTAKKAQVYIESLPEGQRDRIYEMIRHAYHLQYTPIFEFCAPNSQIVLKYDNPSLTTLAMRHLVTGEYYDEIQVDKFSGHYGVPMVQQYEFNTDRPVSELIEHIRDKSHIEGIVVRQTNDSFWKLKCEWYVNIHRNIEGIRFEKDLVKLILNNQIDDVIPNLPDNVIELVIEFMTNVRHGIEDTIHRTNELYEQDKHLSRKDFHMKYANHQLHKFLMKAYSEENLFEVVRDHILWYTGDATRLESVRWAWGGAKYVGSQQTSIDLG